MKRWLVGAAVACLSWSCGAGLSSYGGGSFGGGGAEAGATVGGVKDLALARAKVQAGTLPAVEDLAYEGLYSEHDLPVAGPPCQEALCVRAAAAVAPDVNDPTPTGWIQLGLSSGVDLATFRRPPLSVALVIDNSGSMGVEKMEAVKAAALKLVELLGPDDRVALVRFDDNAEVLVPSGPPNATAVRGAIAGLHAAGGTCIECGLRLGLGQLRAAKQPTRANRVLLFTDAMPNVGATTASPFMTLLTDAAAEGLHATIFGVGLDFGQALTTQVSSVEGANAVFLADAERTQAVFDRDFDLLVTPIAYDLKLGLTPADPLTVSRVYGAPGQEPTAVATTVKTVFLSRSRGALVVNLKPGSAPITALADVSLKFRPAARPGEAEPAVRQLNLVVTAPAGASPQYENASVRKTLALTRALTGLRLAVASHRAGAVERAAQEARAAVTLLEAEAAALGDPALTAEVTFAQALAALLATR